MRPQTASTFRQSLFHGFICELIRREGRGGWTYEEFYAGCSRASQYLDQRVKLAKRLHTKETTGLEQARTSFRPDPISGSVKGIMGFLAGSPINWCDLQAASEGRIVFQVDRTFAARELEQCAPFWRSLFEEMVTAFLKKTE